MTIRSLRKYLPQRPMDAEVVKKRGSLDVLSSDEPSCLLIGREPDIDGMSLNFK